MNKYIEVVLPEEAEQLKIHYQKVAEREEFDVADVEEILQQDITYENVINAENEDAIQIANLEDGIYQIYISGDEEYEFAPMLVSMPAWTEDGGQLLYEVRAIPKYTKHVEYTEIPISESPKTGDENHGAIFGAIGLISFIIVAIMSCHNRFKCARMSE